MTGQIGVDTSLLIDFFKGEKKAADFMKKKGKYLVVSELVVYEFLCGNLKKREEAIFLAAMQSFPTVNVTRESATKASKVFREGKSKGKPVGHQDALIAGSYMSAGINQIATKNTKHFRNINGLKMETY
ncbi:type II toxin-antitoxin system VapC family toxin [Candidatus Woesearchaeota archaeon]|nr:type II toxin-antitoxin system VapC family toxin [Candidatus Woesearchaeota archaeon]